MASELTFGKITSDTVREATGRGWQEWFETLDEAGAKEWDHKGIVAHLEHERPEASSWWRQSITVAYERARGMRAVGQTADAGGEIRVVKPRERLRMTWQPEGWDAPAMLQLTLERSESGKTAISAHLEKLPDGDAREAMRERWRGALERVVAAV
jgi:Activator of Hsp90 ATPase homolog 1-like protein